MLHTIKECTEMIVINKKINSVDEFVFRLINSRLPVIFYPWNFTPFVEGYI